MHWEHLLHGACMEMFQSNDSSCESAGNKSKKMISYKGILSFAKLRGGFEISEVKQAKIPDSHCGLYFSVFPGKALWVEMLISTHVRMPHTYKTERNVESFLCSVCSHLCSVCSHGSYKVKGSPLVAIIIYWLLGDLCEINIKPTFCLKVRSSMHYGNNVFKCLSNVVCFCRSAGVCSHDGGGIGLGGSVW